MHQQDQTADAIFAGCRSLKRRASGFKDPLSHSSFEHLGFEHFSIMASIPTPLLCIWVLLVPQVHGEFSGDDFTNNLVSDLGP